MYIILKYYFQKTWDRKEKNAKLPKKTDKLREYGLCVLAGRF
jgi:hypothetical protein